MDLLNEFRIDIPVDQAWAVLTDVERIAPCLPGAELQEIEGDEYRGIVKVKVGPITAQYKGAATFQEKDDANHKAVLKAGGRDTRGQGSADALITLQLTPDGTGTKAVVSTDLTVKGKVAQFGRGVLADVSAKLLDQFVASLETEVLSSVAAPAAAPEPAADVDSPVEDAVDSTDPLLTATAPEAADQHEAPEAVAEASAEAPPTVRKIQSRPAEPVDLLESAGSSVAKRAIPAVVVVLLLLLFGRRRRRG